MPTEQPVPLRPLPAESVVTLRYLPRNWRSRVNSMHQLLGLRSRLLRAHRDGRVQPGDEDEVAAWIDWLDARAGDLARRRMARRRRAERRMARASMFLLLCVVVATICGLAGVGTVGVGVMLFGVAIASLAALISIPAFFGAGNLERTARQADY